MADVMTETLHGQAMALRAQGMSYARIAGMLGISASSSYRWLNPGAADYDRQIAREYKQRNRDRLRVYNIEYDITHRTPCPECGQLRNRRSRGGPCQECITARAKRRADRIVQLYEQGMPLRDIAAEIGTTTDALSVDLVRLRRAGQIGYRYNMFGKRMAA